MSSKNKNVLVPSSGCNHQSQVKILCGQEFITLGSDNFHGGQHGSWRIRVLSLHGTPRTLIIEHRSSMISFGYRQFSH